MNGATCGEYLLSCIEESCRVKRGEKFSSTHESVGSLLRLVCLNSCWEMAQCSCCSISFLFFVQGCLRQRSIDRIGLAAKVKKNTQINRW